MLPLSLLVGAAACTSKPKIGVETVLARTGLPEVLFAKASEQLGTAVSLVVDEDQSLVERLRKGELDAILTDGTLGVDALLREGIAGSAEPVLHDEMVLVGPKEDPVSLHAERTFENALRVIIEGDAAFYRCLPCGSRSREDAIFATAADLPRRGSSFLDVGKNEDDVVRAMEMSPGYGFVSRPRVIR